MSVYISNMEMPTSCYDCPLAMQDYTTLFGHNLSRTRNSYACVLTHKAITSTKRNRFCPLVSVPKHGRLIDADALIEDLKYDVEMDAVALDSMEIVGDERRNIQGDKDCKQNCIFWIEDASTIIQAEEET